MRVIDGGNGTQPLFHSQGRQVRKRSFEKEQSLFKKRSPDGSAEGGRRSEGSVETCRCVHHSRVATSKAKRSSGEQEKIGLFLSGRERGFFEDGAILLRAQKKRVLHGGPQLQPHQRKPLKPTRLGKEPCPGKGNPPERKKINKEAGSSSTEKLIHGRVILGLPSRGEGVSSSSERGKGS